MNDEICENEAGGTFKLIRRLKWNEGQVFCAQMDELVWNLSNSEKISVKHSIS